MSLFGITRRAGVAIGLAVTASVTVAPLFAQEEEDPQEQQEQQEPQTEEQAQVQEDNLLARAEESGRLSLFVRAVKQAGLASELQRKGPYTVFAPTDEAFRAHFSQAELDRLLGGGAAGMEEPGRMEGMEETEEAGDPEQRRIEDPVMEGEAQREGYGQQGAAAGRPDAELVRLLRAHILTGEVPASRLQDVRSVQNVLGQDLAVSSGAAADMARARTDEYETGEPETEGEEQTEAEREQKQAEEQAGMEPARAVAELRVGDAAVVEADIEAGNGILHLIDGVIVPEPAEETRQQEGQPRPQEGQDRPQPMEQDTTEQDTTEVPPVR